MPSVVLSIGRDGTSKYYVAAVLNQRTLSIHVAPTQKMTQRQVHTGENAIKGDQGTWDKF